MRIVDSHLLEEKMDDAVAHYINSHQQNEHVHVDASSLSLNVHDDPGGRIVTVMHPPNFSTQLCRQISLNDASGDVATWGEELMDAEGRLAAIVAHLAQHSRTSSHHALSAPTSHPSTLSQTKQVTTGRGEVDSSVMIDVPMRLFNGQSLGEEHSEPIVVQVPPLSALPPLQDIKHCQDTVWYRGKESKPALKEDKNILTDPDQQLELSTGASAQSRQQNKKSLPHKKRISRKLKRNTGCGTPQQVEDLVVINCPDEVQQEEILPDNFVATVQHQDNLPEDTQPITQEMRPIFICQLCGDFYGEEQLKFFHHLKQHYEPLSTSATIIIENPVSELAIDKMNSTCIVDNVATLPDSLVELSLENSMPTKTAMYQPTEKHVLYTSSDKTLYGGNKVLYSMASMDKDQVTCHDDLKNHHMYDGMGKIGVYSCTRCNKSFRKQKLCEAHIKEAHTKLDVMSEFSEPEDLMEGIHVMVDGEGEGEGGPDSEGQYNGTEGPFMPHLTVENGQVHQEHIKHWYLRTGSQCGEIPVDGDSGSVSNTGSEVHNGYPCPVCPASLHSREALAHHAQQCPMHLKEEVLQRIFEVEVDGPESENFTDNIIPEQSDVHQDADSPDSPNNIETEKTVDNEVETNQEIQGKKRKCKRYECAQCDRVFNHRNSLLYHTLSHSGQKPYSCSECSKGFCTSGALKVHSRVHNGDKPYKCDACGRAFRQWGDLKYHISSIHSDQKQYKCEFCGKEFARKYSLSIHRRIHTGERNYKCEYCNKSFRASSYRLCHMRIHTGEKPHKCEECGKTFRVGGDLRRHVITHSKFRNRHEEMKAKVKIKHSSKEAKSKNENPKSQPETIEIEIGDAVEKNPKILQTAKKKEPAVPDHAEKKKKSFRKVRSDWEPKKEETRFNLLKNVIPQNYVNNVIGGNKFEDQLSKKDVNDEQCLLREQYSRDKVVYNMNIHNQRGSYRNLGNIENRSQNCRTENTDRISFHKNEITDGKGVTVYMHDNRTQPDGKSISVFTHESFDKNREYAGSIVANELRQDVKDGIPGEAENGFIERLTALYNIAPV